MSEAPRISAEDLKQRIQAGEHFSILDVRNPQAWGESDSKARGAIRVSLDDFASHLGHLPKNQPIVAYCT